jgi:hypothetical protein
LRNNNFYFKITSVKKVHALTILSPFLNWGSHTWQASASRQLHLHTSSPCDSFNRDPDSNLNR